MILDAKMDFRTRSIEGEGITIPNGKRVLLENPKGKCTLVESPVRLGGAAIIDVRKIGAFTIIPPSGLIRCIENIGRFTIIAPEVQIGNPQHSPDMISPHPLFEGFDSDWNKKYHTLFEEKNWILNTKKEFVKKMGNRAGYSKIGNDVWIGFGAIIM